MEHGVRLTLAYDGTDFAGFQRQREERTVQSVLEAAIAKIEQRPVAVRAAGRTDAGVHAQAQIVAFDTHRLLTPARWRLAINRYLPPDVAVQEAAACAPLYNPRFDAIDKTYRYVFYLGHARDPLSRQRAWHLTRGRERRDEHGVRLDLEAMHATCALLVGTHDFRAFRAADDVRDNSTRTMYRVQLTTDWLGHSRLLALEVQGSAFMKNMVRILAGTLVTVGRGRLGPADVAALLTANAVRHKLCETAPAHGLTLVQVRLGRVRPPAERPAP
jgi:tRNA pseudouridine38-40 synthase